MFSVSKFRRHLKEAGMDIYGSLTPLAREADIHLSTLSYIVSGKRNPSLRVAIRLVKALNRHLPADKQIGITDLIRK